jgi:hypothetical protein
VWSPRSTERAPQNRNKVLYRGDLRRLRSGFVSIWGGWNLRRVRRLTVHPEWCNLRQISAAMWHLKAHSNTLGTGRGWLSGRLIVRPCLTLNRDQTTPYCTARWTVQFDSAGLWHGNCQLRRASPAFCGPGRKSRTCHSIAGPRGLEC